MPLYFYNWDDSFKCIQFNIPMSPLELHVGSAFTDNTAATAFTQDSKALEASLKTFNYALKIGLKSQLLQFIQ